MCQYIAQIRGTGLRREAKKGAGDLRRALKQKPVERARGLLVIPPHLTRTNQEHEGLIPMRHGHLRRSHRIINPEVADRLLESLRPTRHLLMRSLAEIPIGDREYCQIDRIVREIDGLAEILIADGTHSNQKEHSAPDNRGR
jgi:hypothetical protein